MSPNAEDTRPELSCAVLQGWCLFVVHNHGRDVLEEIAAAAGVPLSYLSDRNNWISYECFNRLLRLTEERTRDKQAAYKAGLYNGRRACWSFLHVLVMSVLSVRSIYRLALTQTGRYSKVGRWRILVLDRGHALAELRLNPPFKQTRENCANIRGNMAMLPQLAGMLPARSEHRECLLNGADACVYEFWWRERSGYRAAWLGGALGLLVAGVVWSQRGGSWSIAGQLLGGGALVGGGCAIGWVLALRRRLRQMRRQNEEEARELNDALRRYEELNADLQARVEQRTEDLRNANARLEVALAELKESQERVLVAEKQAAIGVLAGGMAHELNNPLNAARLWLQDMLEDIGAEHAVRERLEKVQNVTTRLKRIVQDLLTFAREPDRATLVDVRVIVEAGVELFDKELKPEGTTVTCEMPDGLTSVRLDRTQIQQALLNLLSNASDAMEGRGEIRITLSEEGDDILLSVADTGPGMSEAVRSKVFDPFFTTKAPGKGTGLGLSITYQIVERNGGSITVQSEEGKGSTFTMRFPLGGRGPAWSEKR